MSMNWLEGMPPQMADPMTEQMGTPMMKEQMGGPMAEQMGRRWRCRSSPGRS